MEAGPWPVGDGGVIPRQDLFDGLCLLFDCREMLDKVLNSVAKRPACEMGALRKRTLSLSLISSTLSLISAEPVSRALSPAVNTQDRVEIPF